MAVVAPEAAEAVLKAMRAHPLGDDARVIGTVVAGHPPMVLMKTEIRGTRVLDVMFGVTPYFSEGGDACSGLGY